MGSSSRQPTAITWGDVWDSGSDQIRSAQTAFAMQASALRWPEADFSNIPSAPGLLRVRRAADSGDDLWSVFNVLQENLIRGGVRYFHPQTGGRGKSRAIRSITENVRLNQELWQLAEDFSRN
jgi:hypothetical protein